MLCTAAKVSGQQAPAGRRPAPPPPAEKKVLRPPPESPGDVRQRAGREQAEPGSQAPWPSRDDTTAPLRDQYGRGAPSDMPPAGQRDRPGAPPARPDRDSNYMVRSSGKESVEVSFRNSSEPLDAPEQRSRGPLGDIRMKGDMQGRMSRDEDDLPPGRGGRGGDQRGDRQGRDNMAGRYQQQGDTRTGRDGGPQMARGRENNDMFNRGGGRDASARDGRDLAGMDTRDSRGGPRDMPVRGGARDLPGMDTRDMPPVRDARSLISGKNARDLPPRDTRELFTRDVRDNRELPQREGRDMLPRDSRDMPSREMGGRGGRGRDGRGGPMRGGRMMGRGGRGGGGGEMYTRGRGGGDTADTYNSRDLDNSGPPRGSRDLLDNRGMRNREDMMAGKGRDGGRGYDTSDMAPGRSGRGGGPGVRGSNRYGSERDIEREGDMDDVFKDDSDMPVRGSRDMGEAALGRMGREDRGRDGGDGSGRRGRERGPAPPSAALSHQSHVPVSPVKSTSGPASVATMPYSKDPMKMSGQKQGIKLTLKVIECSFRNIIIINGSKINKLDGLFCVH